MRPWIETATGQKFEYAEPYPRIEDVAVALSRICRFTGHCKQFYSVAEHSVHCARILEGLTKNPAIALAGLLHDAAEAYCGDVNTPLKSLLPDYLIIETRVAQACWLHLYSPFVKGALPTKRMFLEIHNVDLALLWFEAEALMVSKGVNWNCPLPLAEYAIATRHYAILSYWPPEEALTSFQLTYEALKYGLQNVGNP